MATTATEQTLSPLQQALLNRADEIMNAISAAAHSATDFAKEQLPDIAMQYVAYGRGYTTFVVVIGALLMIAGLVGFFRYVIGNAKDYSEDGRIVVGIFTVISTFVGSIVLFTNISTFMMVWLAPKVWLIQEIVHMIKR